MKRRRQRTIWSIRGHVPDRETETERQRQEGESDKVKERERERGANLLSG